ncbi:MAG TPA: threonine synthase [Gemmatimonadales bacterium]|nr:threonine synthase [Gemmatimonadales bacterium]
MTVLDWMLACSECDAVAPPDGLPTVCACGRPWLVRYPARTFSLAERDSGGAGHGMWRYRGLLPLARHEEPVTLGEGDTPLLQAPRLADALGCEQLWVKDEGGNPTGSFKARGLAAAVTRAVAAGATQFTLPTAGNAGVAAAAYGARAGIPVRIYAPATTPRTILDQITLTGGELVLLDGHIGDCGKASRTFAAESGAFDLSTLREPYRIEGKKTLGIELAEQLGWTLPDAVLYPTGGGTGLIGMWKVFQELREAGWITGPLPRMYAVQADGCAPVVRAFDAGHDSCEPWVDPWTVASGLRVPGPLGDRLILRALRESRGGAVAVSDEALIRDAKLGAITEGLDLAPEGGAVVAGLRHLLGRGLVTAGDRVVLFNTGAGWLYRAPSQLPPG